LTHVRSEQTIVHSWESSGTAKAPHLGRRVVIKGVHVIAAVLVLAAPAAAQEQGQSAVPAEAQAQVPAPTPTPRQMVTFEAILIEAVRSGAVELRKLAGFNAPDLVLSDPVEATGFQLPDYGVLFHVRVPGISSELALLLRLQSVRNARQLAGAPQAQTQAPGNNLKQTMGARVGGEPGQQVALQVPPPSPFIDPDMLTDPDAVYTREVKSALIEAMLDYGPTLRIAAGGNLIVAARDNARPDPQRPGDQFDYQTVEFRVSAGDLIALQQGKITREEARKRVTVREY
jgi:hypothetical protein